MAGIGSYEKGKAFTLKSGNKPSFKNVGSSPAKHKVLAERLGIGGKHTHTTKKKTMRKDLKTGLHETVHSKLHKTLKQGLKEGSSETAQQHKTIKKRMMKSEMRGLKPKKKNVLQKVHEKLQSVKDPLAKQKKKSPAKTHDGTKSSTTHYKDGSAKSKREVAFSKRHEAEVNKTNNRDYQKRKEQLLNQGFTQEDADQMIKSGAVTGRVGERAKAEHPKYEKKKSPKK